MTAAAAFALRIMNNPEKNDTPSTLASPCRKWLKADVVASVVLYAASLPFHDYVSLVCGYPLRVVATWLSVGFLRLLGADVTGEATTIHVGAASIAITDACSGVEELIAMLFVGWLIARYRQRNFAWALFAMAFSVPAVIVANAIRLVALVALYGLWGPTVLEGAWHVGLGWAQVALALALMWGAGEVVRKVS